MLTKLLRKVRRKAEAKYYVLMTERDGLMMYRVMRRCLIGDEVVQSFSVESSAIECLAYWRRRYLEDFVEITRFYMEED